MKPYSEHEVQQAIQAIKNGQSTAKAALEWGIPRSTLRYRLYGTQPHSLAAESQQRLSQSQETHLAQWIVNQANLGLLPTYFELRLFAQRVFETKGDSIPLGKRWVQAFLKRNPSVKVQKSQRVDSSRVSGATTEVIHSWFRYLDLPEVQAIKPANRWNLDEAGILEDQEQNGLVLGSHKKRSIQRKQPGSRVWTSFLKCISAEGIALPPAVIFKGKLVQSQCFPADLSPFKDWEFTTTKNGWIDNQVALEWLRKVFVPRTKPTDPSEKRLLILDCHRSHVTTDFM